MSEKYISLNGLSVFYSRMNEWAKSIFAEKKHLHQISEIDMLQRRLDELTPPPEIETSEDVIIRVNQLSLSMNDLINTIGSLTNTIDSLTSTIDLLTPSVGEIYITASNEHPSVKFGGTWEQIKDMFLLAAGDTYNAGSIGGSAVHFLTINEMPSHTHNFNRHQLWRNESASLAGSVEDGYGASNKTLDIYTDTTTSTGGGAAHNNMPPYLTVYVWKRVA